MKGDKNIESFSGTKYLKSNSYRKVKKKKTNKEALFLSLLFFFFLLFDITSVATASAVVVTYTDIWFYD